MQINMYHRALQTVSPVTPEELQEQAILHIAGLPEQAQAEVVEFLIKLKAAAEQSLIHEKLGYRQEDHTQNCAEAAFHYSRIALVDGLLSAMFQINQQPVNPEEVKP